MPGYPNPPVVFDHALGVAYTAALLWLAAGTVFKMAAWLRSKSALTIPIAPAPSTKAGVAGRLFLEFFAFRSLLRASPITWIASLALHYGLLCVLLMHLRFVFEQLPVWLIPLISLSAWASGALLVGLLVLLGRRCFVDRVRYISAPSDYLHLLLLVAIVVSGLLLKRVWPTNLYQVGEFLRGTFTLAWHVLPDHTIVYIHLLLVLLLLLIFPISKLVHGLGIVFAPTFNQRDARSRTP